MCIQFHNQVQLCIQNLQFQQLQVVYIITLYFQACYNVYIFGTIISIFEAINKKMNVKKNKLNFSSIPLHF